MYFRVHWIIKLYRPKKRFGSFFLVCFFFLFFSIWLMRQWMPQNWKQKYKPIWILLNEIPKTMISQLAKSLSRACICARLWCVCACTTNITILFFSLSLSECVCVSHLLSFEINTHWIDKWIQLWFINVKCQIKRVLNGANEPS